MEISGTVTKKKKNKLEKTANTSRHHDWFTREMTSEKRAQKFHTDDASVVARHQCGISALVSQTSFREQTSGGVAKCWRFSQFKKR